MDESAKKLLWESAQRIAMKIAELPLEQRETAFEIAKQSLEEAGAMQKIDGPRYTAFVEIQIKAIRDIVVDLDVSGQPKGGHA